MNGYMVRVIADGEYVQEPREFTEEQEHTAWAYFSSTLDKYRRSDPVAQEVAVQLIQGDDVLAESLFIDGQPF